MVLARLLVARGDADEAARLAREAVEIEGDLLGSLSAGCEAMIRDLALLLEKEGKRYLAAEWRAKVPEESDEGE